MGGVGGSAYLRRNITSPTQENQKLKFPYGQEKKHNDRTRMIQNNGQDSAYKICPQNMKFDKVNYSEHDNRTKNFRVQDRLYRKVKCEVGKYEKSP